MSRIVDAEYRTSRIVNDNPLLLALPEQLSAQQLYNAIKNEPKLPENYRAYLPRERQELCSLVKELYVPLEYSADIYSALYMGLASAYAGRTRLLQTKQMSAIGKAMEYKRYDTIPDSPIQAESFAVIGEPGMGKTTTVRKLLQLFPQAIQHTRFNGAPFDQLQITYLIIECPINHSEKSVCMQILEKIDELLGTDFMAEAIRNKSNVDVLITRIAQLCTRFCIGAIVIDEIQNVLRVNAKNPNSGNHLIRFLVELANKSGACLVCVGTTAVSDFFNAEPHLARRTRGPRIPLLNKGETFRIILQKMWQMLAVLNPAPLDREIEEEVYRFTGGCIAKMVSLLQYAAFEAIFFGRETVDKEVIQLAARRHDISARQPVLDPVNLRTFYNNETGITCKIEKISNAKKGRPKKIREENDIIELFASVQNTGKDFCSALKEKNLVWEL